MSRTRAAAAALAILLVLVMALGEERTASAEEPKTDYADGPTACREFDAKNERELAEWTRRQPAVPYRYVRDDEVAGAPWGPLTKGLGSTGELLVASLVPHFGAQLRADTPAALISWPWSLPIGPAYTCSRRQGTFDVRTFRVHRAMLEPGIISSTRGTGVFVRPGYRFLYHPSDWVVGAGGGLGTSIELVARGEPVRASLGPEAVMQFGHCCDSSYFTFAFRFDHYFAGTTTNILGGSLGYTFF